MVKLWRSLEIRPGFIAFLCGYYYFDPLGTFYPFLLSAGLHELGHLTLLLFQRVQVRSLRLDCDGAVLDTEPLSYRQEFLSAIAGPAVNFLLAWVAIGRNPLLLLVNLGLLFYNLLPIWPLDGGRALRALLHLLLSPVAASILERGIALLALGALVLCSVYLTCFWHAGLWPILLVGLVLLKTGKAVCATGRFFRIKS